MKKYIFIIFLALLYNNAYAQSTDEDTETDNENIFYAKGNKKYSEGKYTQALYWYEKGIDDNPLYDLNYYDAAKVFFLSTETVWGVMYGELFMILSGNDSLKKEISRNLFDSYFSSFSLNKGKTVADFNNEVIRYSDSFERKNLFPSVFNNLMSRAANNTRFIDIASLINIRQRFLTLLKSEASDFDNILFEYWSKIIGNGHWQAYNYWLFAYGNNNESAVWIKQNKEKWNSFLKWFEQNAPLISSNDYFSRYLME